MILPALTLAVVFLAFAGKSSDRVDRDWREDLLSAATACGALAAFGSELLSASRSLDRAGAAALWGGAIVATAVVGRASVRRGWSRLRDELRRPGMLEATFLVSLTALCAVLFLTAVLSPPNNVDSLNVHMVRVVRWAQAQTLSAQVGTSRPPWAEVMMLHLRQLYGSDRPVALVQWTSLIGILVVATAVADRLGVGRRGQAVSAAFAASLPLAVLTASNTKNDLVVSFWVVGLSYWAVLSSQRRLSTSEVALCGAGIALGLLTKGTFVPAAFPLAIWFALNLIRRSPRRAVLAGAAVIFGAVLILNLGFWMRNVRLEGTPFGDVQGLRRALEVDDILAQGRSAGWPFLSRAASLIALHTIYPEVGAPLRQWLDSIPGLFERGFLASLEEGLWNHEDSAGNLLHFALAVPASLWALIESRRSSGRTVAIYAAAAWVGWASLTLVSSSVDRWAGRYQMGFFMTVAPLVGAASARLRRPSTSAALSAMLLLSAVPYALLNNTRPLIGAPPRTRSESILVTPQVDLLFVSTPELRDQYGEAAAILRQGACRSVGLRLGGRDLEYALWWLLDAPQSGFRLETVRFSPVSEPGLSDFEPCAILCTRCPGRSQLAGLSLTYDGGYLRLFSQTHR